jgi:hypothetical protein
MGPPDATPPPRAPKPSFNEHEPLVNQKKDIHPLELEHTMANEGGFLRP